MEHLIELRARMIVMVLGFVAAFAICFIFSNFILMYLLQPFRMASALYAEQQHGTNVQGNPFDLILVLIGLKIIPAGKAVPLIATEFLETFFTRMRMAMFGGIILAFPIFA